MAQDVEAPPGQADPNHAHTDTSSTPPVDGSGTAWLPGTTPMYGFHRDVSGWQLMLHGNAFAQFLYESGEEHHGSHQAGSINWFMAMTDRPVGTGRVSVRTMVSLEPWTIRGCGYPNLLATGEICRRDSIHDLQHPHDLFMELAARYDRPVTGSIRWQIYAGPAGEPALGPPGFPHRMSAFPNPIAPISHHWLDSTHITFGVVTTGIYTQRWKLETSVFNGREPDAERMDFDVAAFDSLSGRISFAPTDRLTLQVSTGHLNAGEAGVGSQPRTDVNRVTASAIYHRRFSTDGFWATTIGYGRNAELSIIPGAVVKERTHAGLIETAVTQGNRRTWFGRFEIVQKPAHDLHAHEFIPQIFVVGKIQAGYIHHLPSWRGWLPGIGGHVNVSMVPERLAPRYGGRIAPGFGVFLTIRPTGQSSMATTRPLHSPRPQDATSRSPPCRRSA
jgi:hypothetical protein